MVHKFSICSIIHGSMKLFYISSQVLIRISRASRREVSLELTHSLWRKKRQRIMSYYEGFFINNLEANKRFHFCEILQNNWKLSSFLQ